MKEKKAALELSVGTIIIVVLGVTMLILGMVLIRNIMCKTINLTNDVNEKVKDYVANFFTEGGDVDIHCVGEGTDQPLMAVGEQSFIMCTIKSTEGGDYNFDAEINSYTDSSLRAVSNSIKTAMVSGGKIKMSASQDRTVKVVQVAVPQGTAPGYLSITLTVTSPNGDSYDISLDYKVQKLGGLQSTFC